MDQAFGVAEVGQIEFSRVRHTVGQSTMPVKPFIRS